MWMISCGPQVLCETRMSSCLFISSMPPRIIMMWVFPRYMCINVRSLCVKFFFNQFFLFAIQKKVVGVAFADVLSHQFALSQFIDDEMFSNLEVFFFSFILHFAVVVIKKLVVAQKDWKLACGRRKGEEDFFLNSFASLGSEFGIENELLRTSIINNYKAAVVISFFFLTSFLFSCVWFFFTKQKINKTVNRAFPECLQMSAFPWSQPNCGI